jgi:phospholipid-binding lipoprotein MlaA
MREWLSSMAGLGAVAVLLWAPAPALAQSQTAAVSVEAGSAGGPARGSPAAQSRPPPTAPVPEAASEPSAEPAGVEPDPLLDEDFDEDLNIKEAHDPLEGMNRTFFRFNRWLDEIFWRPVTEGYRKVVPEEGRQAVRRAFLNFGSAPIFVNDLLQLRFDDAGETLGRFFLNSTVGMAGLFDAGVEAGWKYHDSDFGETLALYGVPRGPYLVIPVFGPTSIRDGTGDVVDRLFEPLTYIFGIGLLGSSIQVMVGTGTGITTYEAHADELDQLEESSIDFYAALRSVYLQNRDAEVREVIQDSWLTRVGLRGANNP